MPKAKILVVEDESIVAKDLQNRLKKIGYSVPVVAATGEEAINQAAETCPDLVLMDVRLRGDMDGVEAARQIRNRHNIPVIYLTAFADDNTLERAKKTEASGYLIKPFKERELYTSIEIALSKHQLEKQIKENQQWLVTVLKSIGDGVITNDIKELVTFVNPIAEILTGWTQEDACGRKSTEVFNIINAETRTPIESPVKKALQSGVVISGAETTILLNKNGTEIPIDDTAAPIKDEEDKIVGAVLVFRDISERKRSEQTRQKQIEQEQLVVALTEINQLKDDFLNTVSHELRTPLANIKMALKLLKIAATPEQHQRYMEILQAECDREMELVNDLLDLQRLEASSYSNFVPEAVDLQDWLPGIIEPFNSRTQERQQTLQLNVPLDLSQLFSDRASLKRILAELLNNACKYTPVGSQIIVSVRKTAASPEIVPDSAVATIFTVTNQVEIPAAELPRIFEKFYRVPNADSRKQGGTGLGLAIVKKLVEQLQGTIQVESGAGWTTFTVQLTDLVAATG